MDHCSFYRSRAAANAAAKQADCTQCQSVRNKPYKEPESKKVFEVNRSCTTTTTQLHRSQVCSVTASATPQSSLPKAHISSRNDKISGKSECLHPYIMNFCNSSNFILAAAALVDEHGLKASKLQLVKTFTSQKPKTSFTTTVTSKCSPSSRPNNLCASKHPSGHQRTSNDSSKVKPSASSIGYKVTSSYPLKKHPLINIRHQTFPSPPGPSTSTTITLTPATPKSTGNNFELWSNQNKRVTPSAKPQLSRLSVPSKNSKRSSTSSAKSLDSTTSGNRISSKEGKISSNLPKSSAQQTPVTVEYIVYTSSVVKGNSFTYSL